MPEEGPQDRDHFPDRLSASDRSLFHEIAPHPSGWKLGEGTGWIQRQPEEPGNRALQMRGAAPQRPEALPVRSRRFDNRQVQMVLPEQPGDEFGGAGPDARAIELRFQGAQQFSLSFQRGQFSGAELKLNPLEREAKLLRSLRS